MCGSGSGGSSGGGSKPVEVVVNLYQRYPIQNKYPRNSTFKVMMKK
jgi:hypothetical protein